MSFVKKFAVNNLEDYWKRSHATIYIKGSGKECKAYLSKDAGAKLAGLGLASYHQLVKDVTVTDNMIRGIVGPNCVFVELGDYMRCLKAYAKPESFAILQKYAEEGCKERGLKLCISSQPEYSFEKELSDVITRYIQMEKPKIDIEIAEYKKTEKVKADQEISEYKNTKKRKVDDEIENADSQEQLRKLVEQEMENTRLRILEQYNLK